MKTCIQSYVAFLMTVIVAMACDVTYACPACDTNSAIMHAEAARKKAASVGGEWLDTENMIQAARAAFHKHDFVTARHLATEAQLQAELGYKQAMEQQQQLDFPAYLQ